MAYVVWIVGSIVLIFVALAYTELKSIATTIKEIKELYERFKR